jgi:hypothetical protein
MDFSGSVVVWDFSSVPTATVQGLDIGWYGPNDNSYFIAR